MAQQKHAKRWIETEAMRCIAKQLNERINRERAKQQWDREKKKRSINCELVKNGGSTKMLGENN